MSVRATIIDAVMAAVVTANVAGARVVRGRRNELLGTAFPEVYVYPVREEIDVQTMRGPSRFWDRRLSLAVDYWAKAASPELLEEAMDTAGDAIEVAVLAVTTGATLRDLLLTSTEWSYEGGENEFIGLVRIGILITYSLYA